MVPPDAHDFFVASASAAAALIGLLFVALSVWQGRELRGPQAEGHRLRASGALTVFINALAVSLYGLLPDNDLGAPATIFAAIGLVFVVASSLRLVRVHRRHGVTRLRDLFFLVAGLALFGSELAAAAALWNAPRHTSNVYSLQQVIIFCFLFGIARSWELIGGPQLGIVHEVSAVFRSSDDDLAPRAEEAEEGDEDTRAEEATQPASQG